MNALQTNTQKLTDKKPIIQLKNWPETEGQVIVHIVYQACYSSCFSCCIRIHPEIHLLPNSGSACSKLIHVENTTSPFDCIQITNEFTHFTLVFTALSRSATRFDFIEPDERGWSLLDIPRNESDVYTLRIHKESIEIIK